jgi:2-desacetyl-2-hydroxyethyl bacteriochlorophyllide A dehydrogenase
MEDLGSTGRGRKEKGLMKAVMKVKEGVGVEIKDIPRPTLPKNYPNGEVVVKVAACGICGTDLGVYDWTKWTAQYMQIPRVIGHEIAGTIVEVGEQCGNWKVGDRIVADTYLGCGKCYFCHIGKFNLCENKASLGLKIDGGMAEYVAIPSINLFHLPANVSFTVGAAIEPFGVAAHAFEESGFKYADHVLILGCGPIGLGMLMLAKAAAASKVFITGIDLDKIRLEMAKKLGADAIFNINNADPRPVVMKETKGRGVDIVFVCVGSEGVLAQAASMVRPGGTVIVLGLFHGESTFDPNLMVEKELTFRGAFRRSPETWYRILNLIGNNIISLDALISHVLPLDEVERAFQLLKRGEGIKVVIAP